MSQNSDEHNTEQTFREKTDLKFAVDLGQMKVLGRE